MGVRAYDERVDWLIFAGVVAALVPLGVLAQRKGWIDVTNRGYRERSARGGMPLGPMDEVFQPTRFETQLEQDRAAALPAPAPIPGDGDDGRDALDAGRIRIELPRDDR